MKSFFLIFLFIAAASANSQLSCHGDPFCPVIIMGYNYTASNSTFIQLPGPYAGFNYSNCVDEIQQIYSDYPNIEYVGLGMVAQSHIHPKSEADFCDNWYNTIHNGTDLMYVSPSTVIITGIDSFYFTPLACNQKSCGVCSLSDDCYLAIQCVNMAYAGMTSAVMLQQIQ